MFAALRERIAARVPKGRVARSIITLASGTAAAQVITICAMPIVTRLYTPAQMGVISLFLAFFGFWASTLSLRYEYALLIAKDDAESHVVHRLAIILVVAMSILGMPLLWTLNHTGVLGFGLLPEWAPFVATPILLGYGIFMVYRSWALRAGLVKQITAASVARSGANAVIRVCLGLSGGGVPGLFAAEVAGSWAALPGLIRNVRNHFLPSQPRAIDRSDIGTVARKFSKFPTYETASTWFDQLASVLPLPIVASLHGVAAAGWYGLARAMVGIPNTQLGSAVADVFHKEAAAAYVAGDLASVRTLFYKMMRNLALIGLFPLAGVVILSPWGVPWVFGERWHSAGWAAALMAPWLYAAFIASPLSRVLAVFQAQQFKFAYDFTALLLLWITFVVAKSRGLSFLYLVSAMAAAGVLSYLIYIAMLTLVVESRARSVRR